MQYLIVNPAPSALPAADDEEPEPVTEPRPELAEAWANLMNHVPEIEKHD